MSRRITLPQYLAIVGLFAGMITVLGYAGVQRYEQNRIETIIDREVSKLEAITEGALQQQQAVQRAQDRLMGTLKDELRRVVRFGDRQLDSNGRIAIRRAMDTLFSGGAYFSGVELFGSDGHFLMGVENRDTTSLSTRARYLPHPLSQHITDRAVPEQRGLVVYPAELRTRNGVPLQDSPPVIYITEWVRSDAGRAVWLLVTTYDLAPLYDWSHRIANNPPLAHHAMVSSTGKVLVGGEQFQDLVFAEDRGIPGQRLGDVRPEMWSVLQRAPVSRFVADNGIYLRFVHSDTPAIDLAAGGTPDSSVMFLPNEGLYADSFFRSVQGQALVILVYVGMTLIAWGLWSQIAARRILEEKDQALEVSLGRLRHATRFGKLGLLESHLDDDFAYANSTFFKMHGMARPDRAELSLTDIDAMFPGYGELQREHAEAVDRLMASGDPAQTETIDYDYQHPDGTSHRFRMVIALDPTAETPVLRTLYSDISDLYEQRKALARAAEQQTSMFKIIAHELRTPAAATHMIAEELSEQITERTDLLSASGHLLDVIDDLRITVNPDASIESKPTEFALAPLLLEAERQVRALFATTSMKLEIGELESEEGRYFADAYRLRAVLTNLLRNAAYHSKGTSAWVSVDIQSESKDLDRILIRVEDDGCGIPEDSVDRLFDPFERGETDVGGTGVGLHIARSWIELMDGSLGYRPSQFGGACFEIAVPLPRVQHAAHPDAEGRGSAERSHGSEGGPAVSAEAWLAGKSMLLVEDDQLIRMATQRLLEKQYGATVTVAEDGSQALKLFETKSYDAVVTDFLMPNVDGLEMIMTLRAQGNEVPVIALTAATIGSERDQLIAGGADVVVSKPLTQEKLKAAIDDILSDSSRAAAQIA